MYFALLMPMFTLKEFPVAVIALPVHADHRDKFALG